MGVSNAPGGVVDANRLLLLRDGVGLLTAGGGGVGCRGAGDVAGARRLTIRTDYLRTVHLVTIRLPGLYSCAKIVSDVGEIEILDVLHHYSWCHLRMILNNVSNNISITFQIENE